MNNAGKAHSVRTSFKRAARPSDTLLRQRFVGERAFSLNKHLLWHSRKLDGFHTRRALRPRVSVSSSRCWKGLLSVYSIYFFFFFFHLIFTSATHQSHKRAICILATFKTQCLYLQSPVRSCAKLNLSNSINFLNLQPSIQYNNSYNSKIFIYVKISCL